MPGIWVYPLCVAIYPAQGMPQHGHLKRLDRIWIPNAVYFITVCTKDRKPILAAPDIADLLRQEWQSAHERHGWLIGRYVIMPDHAHFFCAEQSAGAKRSMAGFMNKWKEWTSRKICAACGAAAPVWQPEFFDHALRNDELYAEKWLYVRENPVRAGLAATWEEWPYQGFVDFDSPLGS